jgi:uncharacterized protein (DUF2336 family)
MEGGATNLRLLRLQLLFALHSLHLHVFHAALLSLCNNDAKKTSSQAEGRSRLHRRLRRGTGSCGVDVLSYSIFLTHFLAPKHHVGLISAKRGRVTSSGVIGLSSSTS